MTTAARAPPPPHNVSVTNGVAKNQNLLITLVRLRHDVVAGVKVCFFCVASWKANTGLEDCDSLRRFRKDIISVALLDDIALRKSVKYVR